MKKLIAMVLCLALCLCLFGCGGGADETRPAGNDGTKPAVEIPEKPEYTLTINAAVAITGDAFTTMSKAAADFNASQTDYIVNLYYAGNYSDIQTTVQTSTKNDIPAIFMLSGNLSPQIMADPQFFVPVQQFMDEDNFDDSNIVKFLGTNYKLDGKWQVLPWGSSNAGQFWNVDALNALGISIDDMDSYEDILAACDKIAASGRKNFYGGGMLQHNDWLNFAMASEGIDYCDNDNARGGCPTEYLYMSDDTCREATTTFFSFLRQMIDKGYMANYKLNTNDLINAFAAGDVICVDATASHTAVVMDAVAGKFQVGYHVSPTIHAAAQSKGQAPGGNCLFIANTGNYWTERGAWEFLKYIYSHDEICAQYAMDTGYSPVTYSAAESQMYQQYIADEFPDRQKVIDAQNATPDGVGYAPSPVQNEVLGLYNKIVYDMYYDASYTPEKAVQELADQANEALYLYRITAGLE